MKTKKQRNFWKKFKVRGRNRIKRIERTKGFKSQPMPRWRTIHKSCRNIEELFTMRNKIRRLTRY